VDFFQHRLTRQITADMMSEAQTIANKMGIQFRVMLEKRIAGDTRRRHLGHGQADSQHHGKVERAGPEAANPISRNHIGVNHRQKKPQNLTLVNDISHSYHTITTSAGHRTYTAPANKLAELFASPGPSNRQAD
jgi:hypothetical protein